MDAYRERPVFDMVDELIVQQREKGIKKYHKPLPMWNTRGVGRDLAEELTDALHYAVQFKMQIQELGSQYLVLRGAMDYALSVQDPAAARQALIDALDACRDLRPFFT